MLELNNVSKIYKSLKYNFFALKNVSLKIKKGEFLSVIGPSGSGKSTLLFTIGGLIGPDEGICLFNGADIYSLSVKELNNYRKEKVGFVFQQFHLLPYLNVIDNIKIAADSKYKIKRIDPFLKLFHLSEKRDNYPSQLSVGEKQRVALIRALISDPEILLADEPTGNLDPDNSWIIMEYLKDFNKSGGTVVLVTHDKKTVLFASRIIKLYKGEIK